ncbi:MULTISPECIES: hypothetical protein [unclassified Frankia]|uniref:hypothetical protein n=1 Tax=unclassified Frankia TaxID=2632575 RepID=UPI002AD345E2|nr:MULTISPECIES: hypothetical protein [unclassified Frankia]
MQTLPVAGDHVRIPFGLTTVKGVVRNAYNEGSGPQVTIELHIPGADPVTGTFPLDIVEPAEAA